jgi:energy-coupling factor transporter ATP-binding protein EcfA2
VLSANGAGKTTLLRALVGCVRPCAGEVRINGLLRAMRWRARRWATLSARRRCRASSGRPRGGVRAPAISSRPTGGGCGRSRAAAGSCSGCGPHSAARRSRSSSSASRCTHCLRATCGTRLHGRTLHQAAVREPWPDAGRSRRSECTEARCGRGADRSGTCHPIACGDSWIEPPRSADHEARRAALQGSWPQARRARDRASGSATDGVTMTPMWAAGSESGNGAGSFSIRSVGTGPSAANTSMKGPVVAGCTPCARPHPDIGAG